jgi:predicted signal transduction protein with EAL and GGDEF domain
MGGKSHYLLHLRFFLNALFNREISALQRPTFSMAAINYLIYGHQLMTAMFNNYRNVGLVKLKSTVMWD